jgi:hypothetical protein
MMKRLIVAGLLVALSMFGAAPAAEGDKRPAVAPHIESTTDYQGKPIPEFNRIVLRVIQATPADGSHDYNWPKAKEPQHDGVTEDLFLNGALVMKGDPAGKTYCCGLTLEAFLRAYNMYVLEHGEPENATLNPDSWKEFKRLWFVTETNGPGPSAALEKFGMGREIKKDEALPGDFVQIWRRFDPEKKSNGSGHSVVFLDWVKDESGNVTGFRYWSTQPGTTGISENVEYFAPKDAIEGVADEVTYWARVDIPKSIEVPTSQPAEMEQ